MKRKMHTIKDKVRLLVSTIIMTTGMAVPAMATTADSTGVLTGLTNLKVLLLGAVSLVGVIFTIMAISDLSTAIGDRDTASMKQAGMKLAGSLLMAGAGSVLTFLGVTGTI